MGAVFLMFKSTFRTPYAHTIYNGASAQAIQGLGLLFAAKSVNLTEAPNANFWKISVRKTI